MDRIARVLAGLFGVMFLVMGLRWLFDPAGAAETIGLPLLDGVARSSEIGDLGAFFLALSTMVLLGVFGRGAHWLYAGSLLVGGAALMRTAAWLLHDAPFAAQMIIPEVVATGVLLFAASRITASESA